jgi:hypothetical protein
MFDVVTCTPRSSRLSGASRRVITLHRAPRLAAATAKLTGALWRETCVPELSAPVRVPFATTPLSVARKLVIVAVSDSLEATARAGERGLAFVGGATSAVRASTEKAAATSLRIVYLLDG